MSAWITKRLVDIEEFALQNLLPAVVILVIGILSVRLILKLLTTALLRTKLESALIKLIRSLLRIVLYILLFLITASALGIDITGIVALASVLTLAVSLSVQNALTNVIGGFTLLYTKPFATGDYVEIAGQSGVVMDVGLTYTRLATADNKVVSIPNNAVVSAQIVNFTVAGIRRVDITVTASYSAPVEQVRQALRSAASVPTAIAEPEPFAGVKAYGDSAIAYILQVWTAAEDYWATYYEVIRNIKTVFDEEGISMTYPHLHVHLDK